MHRLLAFSTSAALALLPRVAVADYADPGPEAFAVTPLTPTGGASGGSLVVPSAPGVYPLLVVAHGFSANADNQLGWAKHFASYGFVVAVPAFASTFSPNHTGNGAVVTQLVALYTDPATPSAARGKVDGSRVGLEGHSAGGLAVTLAAAQVKPQAVVLFDPVDANDLAKPVYATLCSPVLALFAGPGGCNNQAAWKAFAPTAVGPVLFADVASSNHCDGENGPRAFCGTFCGGAGASPTRQLVYARWATAMFLGNVKGDAPARAMLAQGPMSADPGLSGVTVRGGPACAPSKSDGGVEAGNGADAGVAEGGVFDDAGTVVRADGGLAPQNDAGDDAGCGCRTGARSVRGGHVVLGAAALALAVLARRRRASPPRTSRDERR